MSAWVGVMLSILGLGLVGANLEGPFLLFGPQTLARYRRPALRFLEQDDLMRVYGEPKAVVVFNNQGGVPLGSGVFPRLRRLLEAPGTGALLLPQDFLDVHPDYISNDTQTLTLQGPWGERDAQMTETFARLQDVYGQGQVLGILGNSPPPSRTRRQASASRGKGADDDDAEEERVDRADKADKPARALPTYALYNATGPPGFGVLVHSSGWPVVRWGGAGGKGESTVLSTPVGEPTVAPNRLYTNLVVRFADPDSDTKKTTVEFHFKKSQGWWSLGGAEVRRGTGAGVSLLAPAVGPGGEGGPPAAALGRAYHCGLPLVLTGDDGATLTLPDITIQPFMESTLRFADAFDCIGFTSAAIWSGLMVVAIMLLALFLSICMILDIHTMDRFETNRARQLTITVSE